MKINDPNLISVAPNATSHTQSTGRSGQGGRTSGVGALGGSGSSDDIHLSELVRSLRSLAADSPERQARIEQIAREYARGSYKVDASATASKIIDDSVSSNAGTSE
jgi:flagellar biosynthesis anti-sigma factor FlgM